MCFACPPACTTKRPSCSQTTAPRNAAACSSQECTCLGKQPTPKQQAAVNEQPGLSGQHLGAVGDCCRWCGDLGFSRRALPLGGKTQWACDRFAVGDAAHELADRQ